MEGQDALEVVHEPAWRQQRTNLLARHLGKLVVPHGKHDGIE